MLIATWTTSSQLFWNIFFFVNSPKTFFSIPNLSTKCNHINSVWLFQFNRSVCKVFHLQNLFFPLYNALKAKPLKSILNDGISIHTENRICIALYSSARFWFYIQIDKLLAQRTLRRDICDRLGVGVFFFLRKTQFHQIFRTREKRSS